MIDAYAKAGENAKLADLLQEQLAEARKTLPKDSPELAGMLAQIGLSLLQQKKWTEAEPLLRECLAIREKTQPDVWSTFNTKSMLGGALAGPEEIRRSRTAAPGRLRGDEAAREDDPADQAQRRLTEALDRLIDLSTATNKPDDVKKWQAERAKYPAGGPDAGGEEVTPSTASARGPGHPTPRAPAGQAISYARNQWQDLQTYTRDGELSIGNNVSEPSVRAQAIGRKNYLFVGSDRGGRAPSCIAWWELACVIRSTRSPISR